MDDNKQLTFFSESEFVNSPECDAVGKEDWKMYIDGAARNNPGPAGAGFCLIRNDKTICEQGFFVGNKTNNQAEYLALLVGIYFAKEFIKADDKLLIYSDSQLLARQMTFLYKIKDPILKKMQIAAFAMLQGYVVTYCHIARQYNQRADFLANRGIDKMVQLPKRFLDVLEQYGL